MEPLSDVSLQNRLLSRFRFRQMQVLVALAQQGSIRRAADAVGMTQPGVTKVLAELEQLLGTRLFDRYARGVRPTEAGTELLRLARQTVDGAMSTAVALAARSRQGEGCVRVMGISAAISGALLSPLVAFNAEHPKVQVQIADAAIDELLLALMGGKVDLALCRELDQVPQGWQYKRLCDDELVVVAGAHHPLARKRRIRIEDLKDELWLPGHAAARSRVQLDAIGRELGQPLRLCEIATQLHAVTWTFLRHTRAVTLAPYSALRHYIEAGELAVLRLPRRMDFRSIGMLLPSGETQPATRRLADFLARHHARG
jgi:DNA-binding transcriptional LysR family regulator